MSKDFLLPRGTMLGGHYQIIKLIGKGGMGAVQMDCVLRRFQTEAKLAIKIDHPNVIRIFGFKRDRIKVDGTEHE